MLNNSLALLGAWLLFAGPLYQAMLEMRAHEFAVNHAPLRDRFKAPPVSSWWWILPPVKLWLDKQHSDAIRAQYVGSLSKEQLRSLVDYLNRAAGWMLVGAGAFLLAMHETIETVEHFELKPWSGILISFVLAWLCIFLVLQRFNSSKRLLENRE